VPPQLKLCKVLSVKNNFKKAVMRGTIVYPTSYLSIAYNLIEYLKVNDQRSTFKVKTQ
jgi:hypothetical protein